MNRRSKAYSMDKEKFLKLLPEKSRDSYKNINGRSLIVGGSYGYAGACILNLKAALKTNNGYNTALIDESIYHLIGSNVYECVYQFTNNYNLEELLNNNDAILFGSGCRNMENKKRIFDDLLQFARVPLILDAEAFNILEYNMFLLKYAKAPLVFTPHLGEFARIMHTDVRLIKKDPLKYAREFVSMYDVTLVLKSHETIVINRKKHYINKTGNPVLAKAGSGDILAGLMVGFMSQIGDVFDVCCMSVWLAGTLADEAVKKHHPMVIQPENILEELDILF